MNAIHNIGRNLISIPRFISENNEPVRNEPEKVEQFRSSIQKLKPIKKLKPQPIATFIP
jgi:hypothetical protein